MPVTTFVALLRAVNVGGTGKLPMADLRALAADAGFENVRSYIASGNLVFETDLDEAAVKTALEARLYAHAGRKVTVAVRTGAQIAAVLAANPFKAASPGRVVAIFLDDPPPVGWRETMAGQRDEGVGAGAREIYVHYPSGQADTRLRIRAADGGTARNINTVKTLADWARAAGEP